MVRVTALEVDVCHEVVEVDVCSGVEVVVTSRTLTETANNP